MNEDESKAHMGAHTTTYKPLSDEWYEGWLEGFYIWMPTAPDWEWWVSEYIRDVSTSYEYECKNCCDTGVVFPTDGGLKSCNRCHSGYTVGNCSTYLLRENGWIERKTKSFKEDETFEEIYEEEEDFWNEPIC